MSIGPKNNPLYFGNDQDPDERTDLHETFTRSVSQGQGPIHIGGGGDADCNPDSGLITIRIAPICKNFHRTAEVSQAKEQFINFGGGFHSLTDCLLYMITPTRKVKFVVLLVGLSVALITYKG